MKILLVGEFSRLHNSLKEGLLALGHEVILVNNGDGFKNFPADISIRANFFKSKLGNIPRQIWFRIFKYDLVLLEHGIRFWWISKKLKDFDIVQLINESPIQTTSKLELFLLKRIFKQNQKIFLLCCGIDYSTVSHMLQKKDRYSVMNAYFEDIPEAKKQYDYFFDFVDKPHKKIHTFLYKNIRGVIASDLDYVRPLLGNKKYLTIIANPINTDKITVIENKIYDKINIFLGINTGNSYKKGISFFEKAIAIIQEKYPNTIKVKITKNIPYSDYQKHFEKAHILLDQVYGFDQGFNALEAMAKGKVVFTGAETEFLNQYHLQEDEVAINALPDVDYLVTKLSFLIENPSEIERIGKNAIQFIQKEHHYITQAEKYVELWKTN
ncbi:glycosyltransferase family 1 protein [Flavobacterium sp. F372]|uniref:Glycosyltransferase family 1 protein n=1 Tax=Flavobacterium bernardetii TaxID=2813823 RepID=A0ABR7IUY2_9FLAO|nr:glycosyltransferase [Flavobacterium bernardetii]MBC5833591.1 glycosyltransferase family 1 protein [Flavobacterium bernardetii]NHF68824.1 glycosyltransferase family 1 protein [Flavobacterium bernardetii]